MGRAHARSDIRPASGGASGREIGTAVVHALTAVGLSQESPSAVAVLSTCRKHTVTALPWPRGGAR